MHDYFRRRAAARRSLTASFPGLRAGSETSGLGLHFGNRMMRDRVKHMCWAASLIRVMLAVVLLLARAGLGLAANLPAPVTLPHLVNPQGAVHIAADSRYDGPPIASVTSRDAHAPLSGHSCCRGRAIPCWCCRNVLCGLPVGVLPAPMPQDRLLMSPVAFAPDPGSGNLGVSASPASRPPRI